MTLKISHADLFRNSTLTLPRNVGSVAAMPTETKPCPHCNGTGRVPDALRQGLRARKSRETAGVSLRTMAAALEISPAYLSDLELGRRAFAAPLLEKFEKTLRRQAKPTKPRAKAIG